MKAVCLYDGSSINIQQAFFVLRNILDFLLYDDKEAIANTAVKDICIQFRIKGRIRSSGFLRIFTVAFLLFLAPVGDSNPAWLIF